LQSKIGIGISHTESSTLLDGHVVCVERCRIDRFATTLGVTTSVVVCTVGRNDAQSLCRGVSVETRAIGEE